MYRDSVLRVRPFYLDKKLNLTHCLPPDGIIHFSPKSNDDCLPWPLYKSYKSFKGLGAGSLKYDGHVLTYLLVQK